MSNPIKAIKGGTLIDGTGSEPLKKSVIIVEDSKIIEVGSEGKVSIPSGAEIIDAAKQIVMPGLIDCHTHLYSYASSNKATGFGLIEWSNIDRAIRAVVTVKTFLGAGITSIRDVGCCANIDIAIRDAINAGFIPGPRVVACGEGLTITGGHVDSDKHIRFAAFENIKIPKFKTIDGVTEVLKAVRQQIKLGADWIKFWATGGVLEATERAHAQEFSDEEINVLVGEASRAGVPVCVHALGADTIKICIEAGVKSIEHGIFSDDESIQMMKNNDVYLVPTLIAYDLLSKDENLPKATYEVARGAIIAHEKTIKMAKKAGVKIAMGTDSGSPYTNIHGECQAWEMELMATRGLTEMESIVATTKTAAECIGLGDKTGTIEPGKFADLIILDGDPLQDIKLFQDKNKIKTVMKGGIVYVKRP